MPALLALLGVAVSGTQLAQDIWATLKPILAEKRDPTPDEWGVLNALADRAHAEMRGDPPA